MNPVLKTIEENKLIAVIRSSSSDDAEAMINAAVAGGFRIFEISMQTPQVIRLLETFSKKDNLLFGAGSVTDGEMAQRAINAGAQFISTPYTDDEVINVAKHNNVFVIQGALTPTQIVNAYQLGADLVMVYPITPSGGPQYLRAVRNSLPSVKLITAGGVNLDSLFEYLKDSIAVCIKQSLFERPLVRTDNWREITERARQFNQKLETIKVSR
jgi:2-dehydro-3-deoxyphosphogluconate aldolase / (4S)-4-hydroxy-2-oxoglutarate aldolase